MNKVNENLNYESIFKQALQHAKSIGIDTLDLTDESIGDVEGILSFFHDNIEKLDEQSIHNLAILYGVYIGEVMLKNHLKERNFDWYYDIDMHIIKSDEAQISPITKCYYRLKNGKSENVREFYDAIIDYIVKDKINENLNRHIDVELSNGYIYQAVTLENIDSLLDIFKNYKTGFMKLMSHDGYLMFLRDNDKLNFELNIHGETLVSKQLNHNQFIDTIEAYYCNITEGAFLGKVNYLIQENQIKC